MLVIAASLMLAPAAAAFAATATTAPTTAATAAAALPASNPFAQASSLPFYYPPFDKVQDADYAPAFTAGMAANLAEINAIADNKKPATFDNTIVAMERSGQLLSRVRTVFSVMSGSNTNETIQGLERELAPEMAAHSDAIMLNDKLFKRIDSLYAKRDKLGLDAESKRLLERYHTDFVRAGAKLSAADKQKLRAYNGQLAALSTKFAQNVLKELNASAVVVDTREELDGLSPAAIDVAAGLAKKRGLDGKYVIALVNTTGQAPLSLLTNRAVRERIMAAAQARGSRGGEFDNTQEVLELAKLRAERAALMGYPNYAAYSLEDQTAHDTTAVNTLLGELAKPAVVNARREADDIQKVIDAGKGGFKVGAADWAFYSDKV
ncbi:MAG: dipeptidyl carboxypeptidase II, partial [Janthinobacterium lividum]|nr:dipeptidyl carboxypeptidase II [Janthinobacterium lividum]